MVTTKLNLSMTEPQVRQIYAKQGDTGRVLDITLDQTPEDGTLRILRPDGVEVTSDAVTGGEVESGSTFESLTEADVTELSVGIEPVQDLNGYDKPWVGGAGKNKLQVTAVSTVINGITFTVYDNGTVRINGTATADAALTLNTYTLKAGTAIIYGGAVGGSASTYWVVLNGYPKSGGYDITADRTSATTDWTNAPFQLVVASGVTVTNRVVYPMIRLASETDPTWQPYSNICPITGHDEVEVTRTGKNLLNYDAWKTVRIVRGTAVWENNGVTLTATENDCYTNYESGFPNNAKIEVTEGETITLAWDATPTNVGNAYIFPNAQTSGLVTAHSDIGHLSYTVASGVTYLTFRFGVANSGVTVSYKNIQIVRGTTVPTWTPYQGSTYTTSLGQTVYGGSLDMVTGVLTVDKGYYKVTDVSQISGNGSQVGTYPKWSLALNSLPNVDPSYYEQFWDRQDAVISNMGIMVRESISLNTDETTMSVFFHATYMEIRLRPLVSEFPTLEEAKQVYVGAEFVYPVTPTTYQLTPQQIKTLVGTNNVWASSGQIVNIKFTYGGLFSELPSDATSVVGKCYCDVEQNGVSSMPFTLNVKKNERES